MLYMQLTKQINTKINYKKKAQNDIYKSKHQLLPFSKVSKSPIFKNINESKQVKTSLHFKTENANKNFHSKRKKFYNKNINFFSHLYHRKKHNPRNNM